MRAVNLLPPETYAPRRLPHAPVVLAAALPVLAGSLVFTGYWYEHGKVTARQADVATVNAQIAVLGPPPQAAAAASRAQVELTSRETAFRSALDTRQSWDVLLARLARLLPPDVSLTALNAQSPTPAAAGSGSTASANGFSIDGTAPSHDTVARVLERLTLLPGLSNVTLTGSTAAKTDGKSIVQFTITAAVTGATS